MSKLNDTSIQNDGSQMKSNNNNNNNEIKNKIIPAKDLDENSENDEYDDDDGEDNDVKPVRKAPNELLEEFLVYIMQKNWKDAHKLCKFILIYEPHNETAKEFLPLIETKLAITESDSSENESDSESDDDDDDDIDSDEESDSDSDSDSDTDESDKEKNKKETGLQASN